MNHRIEPGLIASENTKSTLGLNEDYDALGVTLARDGVDIETLTQQAQGFNIAVPSWGTGTGGTRFARFPGLAEPRNIFEKIEDCAVIHQLSQCTSRVSPHFPWDRLQWNPSGTDISTVNGKVMVVIVPRCAPAARLF